MALVLAKTTLTHSVYSSDHWWFGREEVEMVFQVEGRRDECIERHHVNGLTQAIEQAGHEKLLCCFIISLKRLAAWFSERD